MGFCIDIYSLWRCYSIVFCPPLFLMCCQKSFKSLFPSMQCVIFLWLLSHIFIIFGFQEFSMMYLSICGFLCIFFLHGFVELLKTVDLKLSPKWENVSTISSKKFFGFILSLSFGTPFIHMLKPLHSTLQITKIL